MIDSELFAPRQAAWSLEAEQSVLGAALIDPDAFGRVSGTLAPRAFFESRHRAIWSVLEAFAASGTPADELTVHAELVKRGQDLGCDLAYLNSLARSVPSAHNVHRYAEIVAEHARSRALMATVDEAQTIAQSTAPTADRIEAIQSKLGELAKSGTRKAPRSITSIALERLDRYEALEAKTISPGWPTHIPALDRLLSGGLRQGWLYVLAARPSVGKSSFSQQIALGLARDGHTGLMLSMEMGEGQCVDRAVVHLGRVDYTRLLTGDLVFDDWERITEAVEALSKLPYHIDDQGALTIADIRSKARMVKGLEFLVVDYLQLCSSTLNGQNRNAQVEEISRGLKALAKELNIPVIALSQLNRAVETRSDARPTLADLRDSGAIEQDADAILFLRPIRGQGEHKIVGCEVSKNREGATGEFALDFHGAHQRWGESTADLTPTPKAQRGRSNFE